MIIGLRRLFRRGPAPEAPKTPMSENETPDGAVEPPMHHLVVDACGLTCPLPILRAKKALAQLESGQVLKVLTTDRNAVKDFQAFSRQTGNTLLLQQAVGARVLHYLERR
ncbi:Molybdopterin biosynthesis protein MoeB [plant metagenome]|uniref:Molybdopterin biosynthesis protein MoeB n=4 Tax=root TaxID=1 RepID=A0A1C3K8X8_9BURK|nr:Molybdopterin biosynthesis protein MoeB [Orrella dioscoreae]SOE49242.1 Molybdopterin biosynthesis protein MoeB [Orrella dioscoreae]